MKAEKYLSETGKMVSHILTNGSLLRKYNQYEWFVQDLRNEIVKDAVQAGERVDTILEVKDFRLCKILLARYLYRLPGRDFARMVGCPANEIYSGLREGRARVQEILDERERQKQEGAR